MLARISLRQKVTALLLALSLGPLAIAGFVNQNRAVTSGKAAVGQRHAQAARFASHGYEDLFQSIGQDLSALGKRLPPHVFDPLRLDPEQPGAVPHLPVWRERAEARR